MDVDITEREVDFPTEHDLATLRRESGPVPYQSFLIAFIELAERFSFYGSTQVFTNFIQRGLPAGSKTGAGHAGLSGALGMGQRASTGLTTFNQFWVYCTPLLGAYLADRYWGRYKTICIAVGVAFVGHVLLTCSAIPSMLTKPDSAIGLFSLAIIIMGLGTGGFKSNISPLVAEQNKHTTMKIITKKDGTRVIQDPAMTTARIFLYFYAAVNVGALAGQISMVYAEKNVGFWLSYLIPTIVFLLCPIVLYIAKDRYVHTPPEGSVLGQAIRVIRYAGKGKWFNIKELRSDTFWERAMPSNVPYAERPSWMTYDDNWVLELKRGLAACKVFIFFPIYWLTYNQINNNLTSQAAVLNTHGLPNDLLSNLDPLALIILIPITDRFIYPALARAGIRFTPIKRIFWGFMCGSLAMVCAAVVQQVIYNKSECGKNASGDGCAIVDINVWVQTPSYILIAISEIFASITGLEYAFSKAPKNMRSIVMAVYLFQTALSSAIGEAFVSLSADPLLVVNYAVMAGLAFAAGILFWICFRDLDKQEDALNMLKTGHIAPVFSEKELAHDTPKA
ncbi:PTR2-domain-containing protein [Meredithblackwellia eburnea MCA 4105]